MTTDSMSEVNAFLVGGAPAAKFPEKGATVEGTILSAVVVQQTDMDGNLLTWADGNPRMQVVVTLQTDSFDPEIDGDDGMRRLFVRGQMQAAVRQAIAQAGERGLARGGVLKVQYHDEKPAAKKGYSAQKLYRARYTPPVDVNEGDWPEEGEEGLPF